MEGISNDGVMAQNLGPMPPPNGSQLSGLATFMTRLIADRGNYNANSEITLSHTLIELIQIFTHSEQDRLEADGLRDDQAQAMANQMQMMADQIGNLLRLHDATKAPSGHPLPARVPRQPTYAERASVNLPTNARKPTLLPPTKEGMQEQ